MKRTYLFIFLLLVFFFSRFLFDRSQMTPPGKSEIHTIKFRPPNHVEITVDWTSRMAAMLFPKWKYIGSIKTSKFRGYSHILEFFSFSCTSNSFLISRSILSR